MCNTKGLIDRFPDFPSYRGVWSALYVTPMIGSDERIALAVAAIGHDGKFLVKNVLSTEEHIRVFGNDKLANIGNFCAESLSSYIQTNNEMKGWIPPLKGVSLGEERESADDNLEMIAEQGLRFSSFLYGITSS